MPAPDLTPVQSALLTAMREAIVPEKYTNYFQATFLPDVPPTIAFFSRYRYAEVLTVRETEANFLALVQHGDITITHQGAGGYWGHLTSVLPEASKRSPHAVF
jgi:hypothetical protein